MTKPPYVVYSPCRQVGITATTVGFLEEILAKALNSIDCPRTNTEHSLGVARCKKNSLEQIYFEGTIKRTIVTILFVINVSGLAIFVRNENITEWFTSANALDFQEYLCMSLTKTNSTQIEVVYSSGMTHIEVVY